MRMRFEIRLVLPVRQVLEPWYGLLGNCEVLPCRQIVMCCTCHNVEADHGRCSERVGSYQ